MWAQHHGRHLALLYLLPLNPASNARAAASAPFMSARILSLGSHTRSGLVTMVSLWIRHPTTAATASRHSTPSTPASNQQANRIGSKGGLSATHDLIP